MLNRFFTVHRNADVWGWIYATGNVVGGALQPSALLHRMCFIPMTNAPTSSLNWSREPDMLAFCQKLTAKKTVL